MLRSTFARFRTELKTQGSSVSTLDWIQWHTRAIGISVNQNDLNRNAPKIKLCCSTIRLVADSSPRKSKKTFDVPGHAHGLTFSTFKRLPILAKPSIAELVIDSIGSARSSLGFRLLAYVVMPEHVHLLVWPGEGGPSVSRILHRIKQRSSAACFQKNPRLRKACSHQRKDGSTSSHLWMPGGGFDRNLWSGDRISKLVNYIHGNPVRRGLATTPQDYPWSSASADPKISLDDYDGFL